MHNNAWALAQIMQGRKLGCHCAAAGPSSEGVELVVTDQEHACSAVAAAQWTEIVDMVRQCWEMELEARPSAATLETRLQDLVLTWKLEGQV